MRILLPGILSGFVMFIWTSIAHMTLLLGEAGINEIPNESAALNAMQSSMGNGINFHYPAISKLS